ALAQAGQLEGVERRLPVRLAEHLVQRLGAVVGRHRGLLQQRVELVALAEDGLQGKHRGVVPPSRGGRPSGGNYDGSMTPVANPAEPGAARGPLRWNVMIGCRARRAAAPWTTTLDRPPDRPQAADLPD